MPGRPRVPGGDFRGEGTDEPVLPAKDGWDDEGHEVIGGQRHEHADPLRGHDERHEDTAATACHFPVPPRARCTVQAGGHSERPLVSREIAI